jgi:D-alanyl-D-alanine dipeptidase
MRKSTFFAQSMAVIAALGGGQAAIAQLAAPQQALPQPAGQERPAAFVDAATIVPGLIAEMRYATAHISPRG